MVDKKIEIGSVVILKSGGNKMTVEHVKAARAKCVWFQKTPGAWNGPYRDEFKVADLKFAKAEE